VHGAFADSGRDAAVHQLLQTQLLHQMLQMQKQINIVSQQMDAASAIQPGIDGGDSSPVRDLG
jgi:hypothetical protein